MLLNVGVPSYISLDHFIKDPIEDAYVACLSSLPEDFKVGTDPFSLDERIHFSVVVGYGHDVRVNLKGNIKNGEGEIVKWKFVSKDKTLKVVIYND